LIPLKTECIFFYKPGSDLRDLLCYTSRVDVLSYDSIILLCWMKWALYALLMDECKR
jgi:hypothetical protein